MLTVEYRAAPGPVSVFGERFVEGYAIPYGQRTRLPDGRFEIWEPRSAIASGSGLLNLEHSRTVPLAREPDTLAYEQRDQGLFFRAEMPDTQAGRDALELVRKRVLTGASVEFRANRQRRASDGTRVIQLGFVNGLALTARPIYSGSTVEARGEVLGGVLSEMLPRDPVDRAATVSRLAEAAGISESTVQQILRGEIQAPPIERLEAFARVLRVPLDRLVAAAEQDGGTYERERAAPLGWPSRRRAYFL